MTVQSLTDAIAARDKITWNKDCWDDVNRFVTVGNFEDAIRMADIYTEQRQSRNTGIFNDVN